MHLPSAMKCREEESEERKQHATHLTSTYHVAENHTDVPKIRGEYEIWIKSIGFEQDCDQPWGPLSVIMSDEVGMLEDCPLKTSRQRSLKQKNLIQVF